MKLATLCDLLATPLPQVGEKHLTSVEVDSRRVAPGSVFFALPGEKTDGHAFLEEVARKGAIAAVVAEGYAAPPALREKITFIPVPDVLASLQEAGRRHLERRAIPTIAVTGSVGKTSTRRFISTLLEGTFHVASTPGNYNSQIGLPLTLLNHLRGGEERLVLEMGMTHAGEIARLVTLAPPTIAVLTAVDLVHAENFSSKEAIARAKAEIFSHPETELGIVHRPLLDIEGVVEAGRCRKVGFSEEGSGEEGNYVIEEGATRLFWEGEWRTFPRFPLPGRHMRHNFVAAALAARATGVSWEAIGDRVRHLTLEAKRLEWVEKGGIRFLNDSYNASEIAMKGALETLGSASPQGKKIAVLGPMRELGPFSEGCHTRVGEYALHAVDALFCYGEEWRPFFATRELGGHDAHFFFDKKALLTSVRSYAAEGDAILLKGSCSTAMWEILDKWEEEER